MEIHWALGSESIWLTIGSLFLTSLLGLPSIAYLKKGTAPSLVDRSVDPGSDNALIERTADPSGNDPPPISPRLAPWISHCSVSWVEVIFFGINYVVWVLLATGYSACSKSYMVETKNAVALLAFQGWVGIGVLILMNCFAKCQRQYSSSVILSSPSWQGKCGLSNAKNIRWNVWVAGIFYSANALLTSWSVLLGGVALTQALKAFEPVVAAVLSRWMLGAKLSPHRLIAISVIVLGLVILMVPFNIPQWFNESAIKASVDVGETARPGVPILLPALITAFACCAVALRNVFLKWSTSPALPPPLSLLACSMLGAAQATTALLVQSVFSAGGTASSGLFRTSGLNTALCFVGFNFASFNLLSELSPVGHAIGNSSKRMILFASGLFMLGERGSMSSTQLIGAFIAFLGLVWYSIVAKRVKYSSPSIGIQLTSLKAPG